VIAATAVLTEADRAAILASKIAAAKRHAATLSNSSDPFWVWMEEQGDHGPEQRLYQSFPLQGITTRQSDVTLFVRGEQ
jgi:hypothetical protein